MNPETIPYFVHEAEMVRQERTIRRLWIMCLVIFVALILTNAGWLYYESQFAEEVVTQDVDTGNGDALVTGIGDIYGDHSTNSETESP